eukprot:g5173.t1
MMQDPRAGGLPFEKTGNAKSSDTLVVAFSGGATNRIGLARLEFRKMLSKRGCVTRSADQLYVLDPTGMSFYEYKVDRFTNQLNSLLRPYKKICMLGNCMGATAALRFALRQILDLACAPLGVSLAPGVKGSCGGDSKAEGSAGVGCVCDAAFQVCESKNAIEAKDWYFAGPGGWVEADGDDDDDFAPPASGAAQAATHIEGKTWLIGTANGGIWKTPDITELPNPKWTNVLDGQPVTCTSISAMDSKDGVAVAGCGASTSSEMGSTWDVANSGDWGGVMISTDGGSSWSQTRFPVNFYVSSIVVFDEDHFLISARSHVTNATNGGVWVTKDRGATFERTFEQPVFDMKLDPASGRVFLACPWQGASAAAFVSDETNKYDRWLRWSSGITWSGNREAFYPTLAVGKENLFIGALTVNPKNLSDTGSDVFQRSLPTRGVNEIADVTEWNRVANAPRLDNDGMPKDRMALLVGPDDDTDDNGGVADKILFVAGNADALTWRVEWRNG